MISFIYCDEVNLAKNAKSAVLIEKSTGKIIYEKEKDSKRSPASMTKLMTLLILMEELDSGNIKLSDKVHISKNAASMGGTQIYVKENTDVDIETLLKGITIASANDAAVAVSEYIGGTEENFVNMMKEKYPHISYKDSINELIKELYRELR